VLNRGFGGSQVIDSVNYAERIVLPYQPKQIVFYAGGNDINAGKKPERVLQDFQAFVKKVHAALPETRIAYISIAGNPARWSQIERVRSANRQIEAFTKTDPRLRFVETHSPMLGSDGFPKPEIFVSDRLHMNAQGYKIWTGIVGPYLDGWPVVSDSR
jgi:lysophospholipase L1-like esterase